MGLADGMELVRKAVSLFLNMVKGGWRGRNGVDFVSSDHGTHKEALAAVLAHADPTKPVCEWHLFFLS